MATNTASTDTATTTNLIDKLEVLNRKRGGPFPNISTFLRPSVVAESETKVTKSIPIPDQYTFDLGFRIFARISCPEEALGEARKLALQQIKYELFKDFHDDLMDIQLAIASGDRTAALKSINKVMERIR